MQIGLHVAGAPAAWWMEQCQAAGAKVALVSPEGTDTPDVWLLVLGHEQSPLAYRFQWLSLRAPAVVVTAFEQEAAALTHWLNVPLVVADLSSTPGRLLDLCGIVGSMEGCMEGVSLVEGQDE